MVIFVARTESDVRCSLNPMLHSQLVRQTLGFSLTRGQRLKFRKQFISTQPQRFRQQKRSIGFNTAIFKRDRVSARWKRSCAGLDILVLTQ